jgi:metallo-beta-lactamase family protein
MLQDPNPFGFKSLKYIRDTEGSKKLNDSDEPCIIISSSGMANAGRVKHHLFNNIAQKRNTVLIVGYASPETPAGKLRDGAKLIHLFGEFVPVHCGVEIMDSFSAHADYREMLEFIGNQKDRLKKIFLVHGDFEAQMSFKNYLNQNGFPNVEIPELGDDINLSDENRLKQTPQYFLPKQKSISKRAPEQGE